MLRVATVLTVASLLLMGVSLAVGLSVAESSDTAPVTVDKRVYGYGQIRYGGKGPEAWRWEKILVTRRAQAAERRLNEARGTIRQLQVALRRKHEPSSLAAIALASVAYRVDYGMLVRKAHCETGGTFDPYARNRTAIGREHASGLFQFLPSTFRSTPYAAFSIWDPYANALAAGWMHSVGRGGEWVCR